MDGRIEDRVNEMDKALDKVITKLTKIKGWYAENKKAILSGEMGSDKVVGKYYSELVIIGQFMSNLARGLSKISGGYIDNYDGIVNDLLNDNYLKGTEEWFEIMLGRKIVWDE